MITHDDLRRDPLTAYETVVVGVVVDAKLDWYVAADGGYPWRDLDDVFVDGSFDEIATRVEDDRVRTRTLRQSLAEMVGLFTAAKPAEIQEILRDYYPSLLFDFETRASIEFVADALDHFHSPHGWRHRIHGDLSPISGRERYWILDSIDLFKEHLFDWSTTKCTFDSTAETQRSSNDVPSPAVSQYLRFHGKGSKPWWKFWGK